MNYHLYDENLKYITSGTMAQIYQKMKPAKKQNGVACWHNGKIYRNINHAAKSLSINPSQLGKHLHREKGYNSVKAMQFSFVTDPVFLQEKERFSYAD